MPAGRDAKREPIAIPDDNGSRVLSPREREVLGLLGDGLPVTDIAATLGRSPKTIEAVTVRLRAKVGCDDMATLRRYAVRRRRQELTAHLLSRAVPPLHHPILDHEHDELLRLLSRVERDQHDTEALVRAFDDLLACARFHIDGEEALMRRCSCPDIEVHVAAHRRFLSDLDGFRCRLGTDATAAAAFQIFVTGWLGHHIEVFDRPLAACLAQMEGAPALAPIDHGTPAVDPAILDRALRSHLHWKMRLYAIIVDQDAQALDRPRLCADGHCDLGRWIHDDHGEFADAPRFGALREAHRQFHLSAGRICDLAVAGDWNEALRELHAGAFYRWSEEVARCIASLRGGPGNGPQASSP